MAIKHGSRAYSRIEEQLFSKSKQSFFNLFFWSVIEWLGSKDEGNGMQLSQDHLTNFNTNNPVAGSDLHTAESGKPSNNDSDAGLCSRLIMYNRFFFLINHIYCTYDSMVKYRISFDWKTIQISLLESFFWNNSSTPS